nr:class I SAM-dependent methyltransferase [Streptomyces sp. S1D4-11]
MDGEVRFEPDLYRGTAGYYDRFRLPYPDAMIADLLRRTAPSRRGSLLDLACGTGQLAFPLRDSFTDVWCVDAESGMTEVVRAKAIAVGAAHIRTVTVGAEELSAGPDSFELIVIGNAFHRLRRAPTAGRAHTWLRPGGCLALCWSTSPGRVPRTGSGRSPACCENGRTPSARPDAFRPAGTSRGSGTPTTTCCPVPGSSPPDATSSRSSTTGRSVNSPGTSGRHRSCRRRCSRTTPPPSTPTSPPNSAATRPTTASPRQSASPTNWPANRHGRESRRAMSVSRFRIASARRGGCGRDGAARRRPSK